MSEIKAWYSGKNVLVTGATGFVGKCVVERLLRDCDEVNTIYLIIRGKKNFDARCKEFLNNIVFDHIRSTNPKQLEKIKIFEGDLSEDYLGLSTNNLSEILNNINIVIHSGADVRFNLSLREILSTNTIGTYRFLELAKRIKNLLIFVYVSTTFSQSHQKVTKEQHYDAEMDMFTLEKALNRFNDQIMLPLQSKILKEFPNTYSFSKHLSEDMVYRYRHQLPICVVRPSIVSCAIKYPMPSYTEGLSGFNGWTYASMRGVFRTSYCVPSANLQTISVDYVVNTIIATSWIHGTKKVNDIEYYNANAPNEIMKTYKEAVPIARESQFIYPLNYALSSPNNKLTTCKYYFRIRTIFYQVLPAALLDVLIWLCKEKPIMLKVQRKISQGVNVISPYMTPMKFEADNFRNFENYLNVEDRSTFGVSFDCITIRKYTALNAYGIRKFIAKEKDEDLPKARTINLTLYWLDIAMKVIVLVCLIKCLYNHFF